MATHERLLKVSSPPDPTLHLLASEQVLALRNELVSAELNVLVEEVATEDLLSVLVVDHVGGNEEHSESDLGRVLQVLVVEVHVVIVKEDEGS